jgi:hypothetical protein
VLGGVLCARRCVLSRCAACLVPPAQRMYSSGEGPQSLVSSNDAWLQVNVRPRHVAHWSPPPNGLGGQPNQTYGSLPGRVRYQHGTSALRVMGQGIVQFT